MADQSLAVIAVSNVKVSFGAVKALDDVSLAIFPGECVGLVGHNGAGKSTIVNVINGGLTAHAGTISFDGAALAGRYGINRAHAAGIRCVFQELSLCPNLTVIENTRVMHGALKGWGWRRRAAAIIQSSLDEIFPGNGIDISGAISRLSIAERQMVEIATAFSEAEHKVRLVILDEPTSSLDASLAAQLLAHVRRFVAKGGAVIFISHILGEVLTATDRIVVMKDGKVVADRPSIEFDGRSLVAAMGSVVKERVASRVAMGDAPVAIGAPARRGRGLAFTARRGEIIGLAGLGGHGQTDMLVDLYLSNSGTWWAGKDPAVTFVAGDRMLNGVFPLWSILRNLTVSNLGDLSKRGLIDRVGENLLGARWKERIEIRAASMENRILSLSGGNQQKVLFARALATRAPVVLMDDPMRGVDIGTKQEVYGILRQEAANGRSFIWYSTEMDEITLCDRVYVFSDGVIVRELVGDDVTEENVLSASFMGAAA